MPGKMEDAGIHWCLKTFTECHVPAEYHLKLYEAIREHYQPMVQRTAQELMAEKLRAMAADIEANIQPGSFMPDDAELMRNHDLDPSVRADRRAVRKFLRESDLVQFVPGQPSRYMRRLTNGNGSAKPVDPSQSSD